MKAQDGDISQTCKALIALIDGLNLIPNTHMVADNYL